MCADEVLTEPWSATREPALHLPWQVRRDAFRAMLDRSPPAAIDPEEIAAHFDTAPADYWTTIGWQDLVWGLETVHGFFKMIAVPHVPATAPFVAWRPMPQSGQTRIMICTWDRQGLLAKTAAAMSAVRLNILEADVLTREDNVVLDVFLVAEADGQATVNPVRLEEMRFLIEGALSEPPRFASVWACSRHKYLATSRQQPPRITFDNDSSTTSTIVRMEASDRLGLLYDILQTLADSGLNITRARIETHNSLAQDAFHVTDDGGRKICDPKVLEALRDKLELALAID